VNSEYLNPEDIMRRTRNLTERLTFSFLCLNERNLTERLPFSSVWTSGSRSRPLHARHGVPCQLPGAPQPSKPHGAPGLELRLCVMLWETGSATKQSVRLQSQSLACSTTLSLRHVPFLWAWATGGWGVHVWDTRKTAVVIADEWIFYRCILKEKYCKDSFLSASCNNSRLSLRLTRCL
jgi:hypothetical protein